MNKCFFKHDWNGCKCERCGKIRDEGHEWDGCKCINCSKMQDKGHIWDDDEHICKICGIKKYVVYYVCTVNGTSYIEDIKNTLKQKFFEICSNDISYKKIDEMRDKKGELIYYRYKEAIQHDICNDSGIDIVNAPLDYISRETGIGVSILRNQIGIKLFMTKGTINISRPSRPFINLNYSVTKYFHERM